ncbi:hypothetical protein [Streptococcus orisratti]|uniref:NfeD family protein n=1 Tax=Streptococcus orisratti TaxID=114652 RepID=UPI002942538A|nr:hypothetical protein [Streptococcus orisratti]
MAYYSRPPRSNSWLGIVFVGIALLAVLGWIIQLVIPLLVIGGLGYGAYRLITRQSRLDKVNTTQRLQDLKDDIQVADRQVKLLDNYLDEKDYTQYSIVARQLLPKIQNIQSEATSLKDKMDLKIYKRVVKKAVEVEEDIKLQLEKLNISPNTAPASSEEKDILKRAPELTEVYTNIQRDHASILEKIEQADNKAELLALHESNMKRFDDILTGYLKIKENPNNYYNAEERLAQAEAALEKFDLDLDETLRQLNESDLKDFDVSLRMMNTEHKDYAAEENMSDIY